MKIIVITGSIGTGKTVVSKMFGEFGVPVVSADKIVFEIYKKDFAKKLLAKNFGKEIVSKKGRIKRRALGKIVFSDEKLLTKLNALVHPLVLKVVKKKFKEFSRQKKLFAVLEAPVLFESKTKFRFDFLVVVKCSKKNQLKRLLKRGFSKKEALARIKSQIPIKKKLLQADFIINSSNESKKTAKQVKKVFEQINFLL